MLLLLQQVYLFLKKNLLFLSTLLFYIVRLDNTIQRYLVCHVLQRIQNFVPPKECCVPMDATNFCCSTNGQPIHHAVDILFPYAQSFSAAGCDRVCCNDERLPTITAHISLRKLVFTYNFKDGTETITLAEIQAVFGSDLTQVAPL